MKSKMTIPIILIVILTVFSGCLEEKQEPAEKTILDIANDFITSLSVENYNAAYNYFSINITVQLSLEQFKSLWNYYTSTYGSVESIQGSTQSYEQGFDIVRINCTFADRYVITFRLVFDDKKEISGFWTDKIEPINPYIAPGYVDTDSFNEYDVTVGMGIWELPGTITIPNGSGPFPVVVLVHGSGPNDRDETIGPNKPFKDLAWGLASNDIIVLRYDKRTNVYPEETAVDINLTVEEEVIDDAVEAVKLLQTYSEVNQSRIYVLGHSLGGMLSPKIANSDGNISGIVMLAAPARPLEDLIYNQTRYLAEIDGFIDENETLAINMIEEAVEKIKTLNISENEKVLSIYKKYWEYLNNYNQVDIADKLEINILLLQGKRDYQVTFEDDYNIWNNTLSDNTNAMLKTYNTLNHLFITGEGIPTNTEYLTEGHVYEDVIVDISNWINGE